MTPLEAAWEEFKRTASYVAYDWETDREPFDGGFKAGINGQRIETSSASAHISSWHASQKIP